MKVVILAQIPEVNNKYTFSLARGLKQAGVDIVVCGIDSDDVSAYHDIRHVPLFHAYSNISNPIKKILSYNQSWKRVLQYCINNNVNILHVQWYIFSPLDYLYIRRAQRNNIKVVATIHDLLPFNKKFYDFYFHKKIYQKANWVISQARDNMDKLIKSFGVNPDKLSYIPHGHYMDFAENATREESRKYLKLPLDKKIILFFGQIKKVKGVDILVEAMKEIHKKHPEALCLIAGKVWKDDFSKYEQQIRADDLTDCFRTDIKFIPDDQIKYYFNAADIVALPYKKIYQSGVVLLAYAYEKPVVATREGEFLTVVKDKETGLLVPSNDAKAFAKALCWYLDHPDTALEFGKRGKQDLYVRLSWTTIGASIADIYRRL